MNKSQVVQFISQLPPGEFRWIIGASRKAWAEAHGKPRRRLRMKMDSSDVKWAYEVKERDGWACVRCSAGKSTGTALESAHIIPRERSKLTRCDPLNGLTLCKWRCHKWAHSHESEFVGWVREQYPERVQHLQALVPSWKGWQTLPSTPQATP